mmetsp:Transcript_7547/g.10725  ORF Transcript_7547/g.10725 Transcript_7547/m.10725 type:complete len:1036 (+) Transcript_7547:266-3373(+)
MAPKPTEISFITHNRNRNAEVDGNSTLAQPRLARKASDRAKDRYRKAVKPTLPTARGRSRVFRTTQIDDPIDNPIMEDEDVVVESSPSSLSISNSGGEGSERYISFSGRKKNPWNVDAEEVDPIWDQLRRSAFYGEKKPQRAVEEEPEEKKDETDVSTLSPQQQREGEAIMDTLGTMYPSVQRLIGYPIEIGAMYKSVERLIGYPVDQAMYPSIQSSIGYPHNEKRIVDVSECGVKNMVKYWEETLPTLKDGAIDELDVETHHSTVTTADDKDVMYPTIVRMLGYPVETAMYESVEDTMGYPVKKDIFDAEQAAIMAIAVAESVVSEEDLEEEEMESEIKFLKEEIIESAADVSNVEEMENEIKSLKEDIIESAAEDSDVLLVAPAALIDADEQVASVKEGNDTDSYATAFEENSDNEEKPQEEEDANVGVAVAATGAVIVSAMVVTNSVEENEDIISNKISAVATAGEDDAVFENTTEKEKVTLMDDQEVAAIESVSTTVVSESEDDDAVVQATTSSSSPQEDRIPTEDAVSQERVESITEDQKKDTTISATEAAVIASAAVAGVAAAVGAFFTSAASDTARDCVSTKATTPVKKEDHSEKTIESPSTVESPVAADGVDVDASTPSPVKDNDIVACTPMKDISKDDVKATPPTVATSVDSMSPLSNVSVSPNPATSSPLLRPRLVVANGTMRSSSGRNRISKPLVIANGTRRRSDNTKKNAVTGLQRRSRSTGASIATPAQGTPPRPTTTTTPLQPRAIFISGENFKEQNGSSARKLEQEKYGGVVDDSSTVCSVPSMDASRMATATNPSSEVASTPVDPYLHAKNAGILWQSLVGQHVKLPSSWWNGARCPSMGISLIDGKTVPSANQWNYVDRNRFYENDVLDGLVLDKNSAGRLLLHLIVRKKSSALPLADIVVGCYHPCHNDVKATNAGECRVLWLAISSKSGWNNNVFKTILGDRDIMKIKNKHSPLEEDKPVDNMNLRAVFGDNPPVETVNIVDEDLNEQIKEELDGMDTPMSYLLLEMFLRGFAAEC